MYRGRKDIYEFDGTVYELYLLLGIEPQYDKDGYRIKTINELLKVKPLYTVDGYEVPRVLVVKNRVKKLRVIHKNRLTYKKFKYKRKRKENIINGMDEEFLIYLDKVIREYPKKFARGSKVMLKKVNKVSKKYIATKVAKGSEVSLRTKKVLKNRPPLPKKPVKSKDLKNITLLSVKTGKNLPISKIKFSKKNQKKITSAKSKAKIKSINKGSISKNANTKSESKKAKSKKKDGGLKIGLGKAKGVMKANKTKNNKVSSKTVRYARTTDVENISKSNRVNIQFDSIRSINEYISSRAKVKQEPEMER